MGTVPPKDLGGGDIVSYIILYPPQRTVKMYDNLGPVKHKFGHVNFPQKFKESPPAVAPPRGREF